MQVLWKERWVQRCRQRDMQRALAVGLLLYSSFILSIFVEIAWWAAGSVGSATRKAARKEWASWEVEEGWGGEGGEVIGGERGCISKTGNVSMQEGSWQTVGSPV